MAVSPSADFAASNYWVDVVFDTTAGETHALAVNLIGSGSVTRSPDKTAYNDGETVTLTPVPAAGWAFTGWSGLDAADLTNNGNGTWSLLMNGDKALAATFTQDEYTLMVTSAHGVVTRNPDQATYRYGDTVQLTATPAAGWSFANWTGDATGTTNPLSVLIDGNKTVTANYTQDQYTLTITKVGNGTVSKAPDQASYTYNTAVALTATADPGWTFAGWSVCEGTGTCSVTMDGNQSVTATFAAVPPVPAVSINTIKLYWQAVQQPVTHYNVYQSTTKPYFEHCEPGDPENVCSVHSVSEPSELSYPLLVDTAFNYYYFVPRGQWHR